MSSAWVDGHEDCRLCDVCARHLIPEEQWPCVSCGLLLCGSCDCPTEHIEETTC